MNLKRHIAESPEVNLTPLIDVVFLMLIFFMVSTTFKKDQALKLQLPEATAAPKSMPAQSKVMIIITADGKYLIKKTIPAEGAGKPVEKQYEIVKSRFKYLRRAIKRLAGGSKQTHVVIKADTKSPHGAFVQVMDAVTSIGLTKISIVTEPRKDSR